MKSKSIKDILTNNAIYIVLLLLFVTIIIIDPSFLSLKNAGFILSQSATRMILPVLLQVLSYWEVQTSAGRLIGLSGLITASLYRHLIISPESP